MAVTVVTSMIVLVFVALHEWIMLVIDPKVVTKLEPVTAITIEDPVTLSTPAIASNATPNALCLIIITETVYSNRFNNQSRLMYNVGHLRIISSGTN